jgi:nucleotide-binding universal stress UspA family protein
MKKLRKILAPTDLSDASLAGVRYAIVLAHDQGAELIVYHVIAVADEWFPKHPEYAPVHDLVEQKKRALDSYLTQNFSDFRGLVEIRQRVELGIPDRNIIEMAQREAADMIVMSTQGRTGIDHFLLGSVSERVLNQAPCPVLVVPQPDRRSAEAQAA